MGSRIRFTKARQVFETYPDLSETVARPSGEKTPQDYALELAGGEEPLGAIAFFAHVLPKREAVWWGMKCVLGLDAPESVADRLVLELTETWVREGDEDARQAVLGAVEAAQAQSSAVWIGRAASWSGGSLSPNPEHRVDMPEDLTAKALNTALLIALGKLLPEHREDALSSCLSAGLSFAEGGSMPVVVVKNQATAV